MKNIFLSAMVLATTFCHSNLANHLKTITAPKSKEGQIRNIDQIYLINLDIRPERLQKSLAQLAPYQISPTRYPAINGWALSQKDLSEIGVKFQPGMFGGEWVLWFPPEKRGSFEYDFLREACYGNTVFFRWVSPGGIGGTLSHLSVLQSAYDAGYETIWVLEDDMIVQKDPHVLSQFIDKLDALVGKDGWDVLYTDTDFNTKKIYPEDEDMEKNLKSDLWFYWRPDIGIDEKHLAERKIVGDDFLYVGSRILAHSLIVRRSGMKKILDFEKAHGIFYLYDHELPIIPGLKLFNLRTDIVTVSPGVSDIDFLFTQRKRKEQWDEYKKKILNDLNSIHGWRDPQKAEKVMEFIYEHRPEVCVEIGAFGGCITYPLAKTLSFLKKGVVHAIDAWDIETAIEGLSAESKIKWWQKVSMEGMYVSFKELISKNELDPYCKHYRMRSDVAAELFSDRSIDFLFIDGNESKEGSLKDVQLYYPKVREGGAIVLSHAGNKGPATAFLMKHCEWIKHASLGTDCVIFKKKEIKGEKDANEK